MMLNNPHYLATLESLRHIKDEWTRANVALCVANGYRAIPCYKGNRCEKYGSGETYLEQNDAHKWNSLSFEYIGVALDQAVLLDYDGNKPKGDIISVEQMQSLMPEVDLSDAMIQRNTDENILASGLSAHYLFRWPEKFDTEKYNKACNGKAPAFGYYDKEKPTNNIDIKTHNQLVHIKKGKVLIKFPPVSELPLVPDVIVKSLLKVKKQATPKQVEVRARAEANRVITNEYQDEKSIDLHIVERCFSYISAVDYDDWYKIISAVVSQLGDGNNIRSLINDWSSKQPAYVGESDVYRQIDAVKSMTDITFGSFIHYARQHGAPLDDIRAEAVALHTDTKKKAESLKSPDRAIKGYTLDELKCLTLPPLDKKLESDFTVVSDADKVAAYAYALTIINVKNIPIKWQTPKAFTSYLSRLNKNLAQTTIDNLIVYIEQCLYFAKKKSIELISLGSDNARNHNYTRLNSLRDIPTLTDGVHCLSAGHGLGKTNLVGIPFIQNRIGKAMTLCHLRSLASDMSERFGIAHYEQYSLDIKDITRCCRMTTEDAIRSDNREAVSFCLNSIIKKLEYWTTQTGTLLIDEVSQVLGTLATAEYMNKDGSTVYNRLCSIVRNAKRVLVMDADMDDTVIKFLETCRPGERFNIYEIPRQETNYKIEWCYGSVNEINAEGKTVKVTATATAEERLIALVKDNKRVIVATDSKKKASGLSALITTICPDKKVLLINKNTTSHSKVIAFFNSPTEQSTIYDVIIHSPSMRSGVSIENNHFDMGMGIFSGSSITPSDAIQMLRRARNINEWFISVDESSTDLITDTDVMACSQSQADSLSNDFNIASEYDSFCNLQTAKKNMGCNMFAQALYFQMEAYRFNISHVKEWAKNSSYITALNAEAREQFEQVMCLSPRLDNDEYFNLKDKRDRTIDEDAIYQANKAMDFFGIDKLTIEDVKLWDEGRIKSQMAMFRCLLNKQPLADDGKSDDLSRRSFVNVRSQLLINIFNMTDLVISADGCNGVISLEQEEAIGNYIWDNHCLLAYLGLLSKKAYGHKKVKRFTEVKKIIQYVFRRANIDFTNVQLRSDTATTQDNRIRLLTMNTAKVEKFCSYSLRPSVTRWGIVFRNIPQRVTAEDKIQPDFDYSDLAQPAVRMPSIEQQEREFNEWHSSVKPSPLAQQQRDYSEWEAANNPSYSDDFITDDMREFINNAQQSSFWSIAQRAAH